MLNLTLLHCDDWIKPMMAITLWNSWPKKRFTPIGFFVHFFTQIQMIHDRHAARNHLRRVPPVPQQPLSRWFTITTRSKSVPLLPTLAEYFPGFHHRRASSSSSSSSPPPLSLSQKYSSGIHPSSPLDRVELGCPFLHPCLHNRTFFSLACGASWLAAIWSVISLRWGQFRW